MIAFDLQCQNGHKFEGWFEDRNAYDQQQKQGLIACPTCNDTHVAKIPSTFAIRARQQQAPQTEGTSADIAQLGHRVADYVEKNFDNVGADFAEEALKMHYGISEPRNIRGVSTKQEEETLKQEGIQFFKLPLTNTSTDRDTDA